MTVALSVLPRFIPSQTFRADARSGYTLLPIRFDRLDASRYVLTNASGEYVVLRQDELRQFVAHKLDVHGQRYDELKSKHFLLDDESSVAIDLLAIKYRAKQEFISQFTSLFLFVVTLRCDHSCPYCQVSRQSQDRESFDMSRETADRAIDFMFQSPSRQIKVEFQGGEPLLNFGLIKYIVTAVETRNEVENREIVFVIATNLAPLQDDQLDFCRAHRIAISTSLDGPEALHNRNRPRPEKDSYRRTIDGISRARAALGHDQVAALMTTTEASLDKPGAIVDEYVAQGFRSIFLRSISPYGFAVKTGQADRYQIDRWLEFYKAGLKHIVALNRRGVQITELFAQLILTKMLTPWGTGYVDLQSPAGIGISCLVFNYDGDIYASDEGRMLAEMNDRTFRLGCLKTDSFEHVMGSDRVKSLLRDTMLEGVPMCSDCAFLPYCGSDPVYHHAAQGDTIGFKPTSGFCKKHMAIFRHLISLLEDDADAADVLRSWIHA